DRCALWLSSLHRNHQDWRHLLSNLAQYSLVGDVNWTGFDGDYSRRRQPLPTYPFQRQRCWIDRPETMSAGALAGSRDATLSHPLLHRKMQSPLLKETLFETDMSTERMPYLKDHRIYDQVVVAGASYISMLLGAIQEVRGPGPVTLQNIVFYNPLVIPENG